MIGSQNNDRGQITSTDSITNCSMNFYQTDKCKSFLCKLGMRFTKMGCNNARMCIIPPWVVGWNNVGKIQPAINVAAGVAHLAQSGIREERSSGHNTSISTKPGVASEYPDPHKNRFKLLNTLSMSFCPSICDNSF